MAPSLLARAFDLEHKVNMDVLSKFYIVICGIWTSMLFSGLFCLFMLRKLTFIRMRNVALATASVLTIHVYLALDILRYTVNGLYPCGFEYWIMSTYFPIGIALFQAQNMQLLDLSCLQRQLMIEPVRRPVQGLPGRRGLAGLRDKWRQMKLVSKTYVCIGAGIVLQV